MQRQIRATFAQYTAAVLGKAGMLPLFNVTLLNKRRVPKYKNFQTHIPCDFTKQNVVSFTAGKGKGKVHPRTGHEGPEGGIEVQLYSFLNLGARWGCVVNATPRSLYPRGDAVTIV